MKKILIPNGSFHDIPLIQTAKKLGYYVITSGAAPEGLGHRYADEYVFGDFSDVDLMLQIAQAKQVDAVCSNCNDSGYLSACYIAEKLELGGHESYENAMILHHKDKFKRFAKEYNLMSPVAEAFDSETEAILYCQNGVRFPIIIKPTDLGAGQGIHRADNPAEAEKYVKEAFDKSKIKHIVIEPFIEGTSHSFNAFIVNQRVAGCYSDNEYMKYSKYRVSTSLGPADSIAEIKEVLIEQTEIVAEKLNLSDGLVHSQYILDGNHVPYILEITRRMSGDWYPYPEMEATGINWMEYIVKAQCGLDCSDFPADKEQRGYTGRHCLNAPHTGLITDVRFSPEIQPYIYDKILWLGDGFQVSNLEKDYPGIIFLRFPEEKKAKKMIDDMDEYISYIYEEN